MLCKACYLTESLVSSPNTTIVVPDFSVTKDDSLMIALKTRCDDARALGIVRISENEDMVIYQGNVNR